MHVRMWHVHLNIAKILNAFCVCFECTSKYYHNERKYCSYSVQCNCMLSLGPPRQSCPVGLQENNNTF